MVSAAFWTWLWGPIGLILATPLTICLVVIGRHVERLRFLDVLLGDRPALTPTELVYQRLLVGDPIEATEQAAKFLKEKPLLDRNCKAHELDNLYVVDTSFFVSIGAVNPSLTAIANAIRVGDHLLQRLA